MKRIIICDEKSGRRFELTPISQKKTSGKEENYELADCIIANGATCEVFHAKDENDCRYLVKKFTSKADGENDSKTIKEIIDIYDKRGINYFLKDCFVGTDGTSVYHVFEQINGDVVKPINPTSIKELLNVLNEYKSYLESLKLLHRQGIIHCDIKPSNIFRFKANVNDSYSLQILDFGSIARESNMIDQIKENGMSGYTYNGTLKWYNPRDIKKLCSAIQNGEENLEYVLDLTASVRVLCYMMCGKTDTLGIKNTGIEKYLGVCERLEYIYSKATNTSISKRYLSCDDLSGDIDLVIESISGINKYPEALKLISKNTLLQNTAKTFCRDKLIDELREEYNEINGENCISISDLSSLISTSILPHIEIEGITYEGDESKSAIERVIAKSKDNIVLFGTGGGGKSTTLRYLYLSNIIENNRRNFLYLSAKDFKHENLQNADNKIASLLNARYNNCNVDKLLLNKKIKVYILFDGFDEISEINYLQIINEIEEITGYNNQFIIASRDDAERRKLFKNLVIGNILPLTEKQIEKAVPNIDTLKKLPIYKLLHTPMLLTIYQKIQSLGSNSNKIRYPEELIEEYLKKIHLNDKGNLYLFDKFISDVSSYSVFPIDTEDGKQLSEIEEYLKTGHIKHLLWLELHYNPFCNNGANDNARCYRISFSHKLYEDYFKGCWLYDFFCKAISKSHLEINDFYFDADLRVEKDFSPYWVKKLKNKIAPQGKNKSIYKELNNLILQFNKRDAKRSIKKSKASEKRYKAMKNLINMLVLCCDGELVDTINNKPLLELKHLQRHVMKVVEFDNVKSIYIPWSFNMYFHKSYIKRKYNAKKEKKLEKNGILKECDAISLISKLSSKKLVVSKWNLTCKSCEGVVYSKLGTRILNAAGPNTEENIFVIPRSVISIDKNAFQYCTCKQFMSKSPFFYTDERGILYSRLTKSLVRYPTDNEENRFELNKGRFLYPYAFARTKYLKELNIQRIWQNKIVRSLMEKSSIERIALPKKLLSIERKAFYGCEGLKDMDTLKSVRFIKEKAFYGCRSLTAASFFESLYYISWSAFKDCKSLESFYPSKKLKYIGINAFEKAYNLKNLWIDDGIWHVGIGAFDDCSSDGENDPTGAIKKPKYPDTAIIRKDPYSIKKESIFNYTHEYDHGRYDKFFEKIQKSYNRSKLKNYATICNLAFCYENGVGVTPNIEKALELYAEIWDKNDEYVLNRIKAIKAKLKM